MASKTIEQDNDRRLTIMTATFVPCGAKLPVIALMGGVMAGHMTGSAAIGGMMAPLMYFLGIGAVLVSAIMLKKTKPFSGKPAPFEKKKKKNPGTGFAVHTVRSGYGKAHSGPYPENYGALCQPGAFGCAGQRAGFPG